MAFITPERLSANALHGVPDRRGSRTRWTRLGVLCGLLVVSWLWASALTSLRYTYLLGIIGAAMFVWVVFVLRKLAIGLVLVVATAVVLEAELGGFWDFHGFRLGMTDAMMIGLLLAYAGERLLGVQQAEKRDHPRRQAVDWISRVSLVAFVLLFLLSMLLSSPPRDALQWWWTVCLRSVLLFALAKAVVRGGKSRGLLLALLAFAILVAANENLKIFLDVPLIPPRIQIGYAERIAGAPFREKMGITTLAIPPILSWPTWAGALMASLLPVALMMAFLERRLALRTIGFVVVALLSIPLLLYLDRSSWLGGLLGSAIVIAFAVRRQPSRRALVALVAVIVLVGVLAGRLALLSTSVSSVFEMSARSDRWPLWINTVYTIPHTPWLTGIGFDFDAFEGYTSSYGPLPYRSTQSLVSGEYSQPHNSYLHLLISVGLPVCIPFFLLLTTVFGSGVRVLARVSLQCRRDQALLAVLAGWCGLCLTAVFSRLLWYGPLSAMFWLYMGTVAGLVKASDRQDVARPEPISTE